MFDKINPQYKLLILACEVIAKKNDSSCIINIFLKRKDKIKLPFSYEKYINNKDVIGFLKGYGVDVEQFWYVIIFIYDFTLEKCVNTITLGRTLKIQTENFRTMLSKAQYLTVIDDNKKEIKISNLNLIDSLFGFLDQLLLSDDIDLNSEKFSLDNPIVDLYSSSVQMWFTANNFIKLFKAMKLPPKRSTDIVLEYREKNGEIFPVRESIRKVSFNKLFFISQLLYFMKFTKNESFLISDNSLKGILNQYKDFQLDTLSKVYLVWF